MRPSILDSAVIEENLSPYVTKRTPVLEFAEQEVQNAVANASRKSELPRIREIVADVADRDKNDDLSPGVVREAVWRLIASGKLALSPQRRVFISRK